MCATCLACGGLRGERVRVFLEPSCCLDTCVRGRTDVARVAAAGIIGARVTPFSGIFFVSPLLALPFTTAPAVLSSQHGLAAPSASPRVPLISQPCPRSLVRIPREPSASFAPSACRSSPFHHRARGVVLAAALHVLAVQISSQSETERVAEIAGPGI
ncbi:hypothetical protein HETIRDRAFT_454373 [Heterobasidion irregulare TC 32-1]|uniref:Uncharacterized protein n=1 Tax=Heterobasidion irregulare (strain TC 32-1) TaxID=747525 RepID=W4K005_HETIT|nr:uncharacterized protein HETIRDRAFT_454373 [Heterobasidion irregulare TC 32-1]ETW78431.1 hypothetical protein HETIRDRAFT_454373 [Heterobasidion irregulare TC 32-1]